MKRKEYVMSAGSKLPMGIENFERIRKDDFYYVDKTKLIKDLLQNMAYVNLFTRPRRFGKTLNMSMLKYFFEIGHDSTIFDRLEISKEKEICEKHMGKYPVIALTLKGVCGSDFSEAKRMLRMLIGTEAMRFSFLLKSEHLDDMERKWYRALVDINEKGLFTMEDDLLVNSLLILSRLLEKHYGQKVILLIDEYDVPLDKAYQAKYYDEMAGFIRNCFGQALKTNDSLYCAVLTGCLRIAKESNVPVYTGTSEKRSFSQASPKGDALFTGLNNFKVYTVKDVQYNEYFGFTDKEIRELLAYFGMMNQYDSIKEWYDGYHFGDLDIYCPWDVISYAHSLRMTPGEEPQNYWINTSSNSIVRDLITKAGTAAKKEIEFLINGGSVKKVIHQELTYRDLDAGIADIENIWSVLFTTGYLTQCKEDENGFSELIIPNKEIRSIYVDQIRNWFRDETRKDTKQLERFCKAFEENDTRVIEECFQSYLKKTISIRDTSVRKSMKENFYHGILLGLFANMNGWYVRSNAESGEGYSDISVESEDKDIGIVIELKYAENAEFDAACSEALRQIEEKNYGDEMIDDGMKTIHKYGIACYKKRCKVVSFK